LDINFSTNEREDRLKHIFLINGSSIEKKYNNREKFNWQLFNMIYFFLFFLSVFVLTACKPKIYKNEDTTNAFSLLSDQQSEIFSCKVNEINIPVVVVPDITQERAKVLEKQYKKLPSYCWIGAQFMTLHYAHFYSGFRSKISIEINEDIKEFTIYPKKYKIKGKVDGKILSFTETTNNISYLIISINKLPMFVLIKESYKFDTKIIDDNTISLEDFTDGRTNITDYSNIFSKAISKLNGSGKTLYIPKGTYNTDEIQIHNCSNINIYLEPEALIRINTSPVGKNIQSRGFSIVNSENIHISGIGILDHQGYENFKDGRNDYHFGFPGYENYFEFKNLPPTDIYFHSPIMIINSKNIIVEGITIRNSRIYQFNVRHSDNVTMKDVKILTPAGTIPENTDGINVGSTRNFLVDNCFVYSNDDPFSFGHNLLPYDNRPIENTIVKNFFGWNPRANGVRLGWAQNTYTGDVIFQNCSFAGNDDSAFIIHPHTSTGKENIDSLYYSTIRFEDCTFDDVIRYTRPLMWVVDATIKNLELSNVTFDAIPKVKAKIIGSKDKGIEKFLLDNVIIDNIKINKNNLNEFFEIKNVKEIIFK